jgi:hypothetical protein
MCRALIDCKVSLGPWKYRTHVRCCFSVRLVEVRFLQAGARKQTCRKLASTEKNQNTPLRHLNSSTLHSFLSLSLASPLPTHPPHTNTPTPPPPPPPTWPPTTRTTPSSRPVTSLTAKCKLHAHSCSYAVLCW